MFGARGYRVSLFQKSCLKGVQQVGGGLGCGAPAAAFLQVLGGGMQLMSLLRGRVERSHLRGNGRLPRRRLGEGGGRLID